MLIGIVGKKQVGKDTISDYLCQSNLKFKKFAFADALKELMLLLYPQLTPDHLHDPVLKETNLSFLRHGESPRKVLQYIGTELFRTCFDENVWINIVKEKIKKYIEFHHIIISDVRFQNELDSLLEFEKDTQVLLLRIKRETDFVDTHATETNHVASEKIIEIENNGSKEELYQKIDTILQNALSIESFD